MKKECQVVRLTTHNPTGLYLLSGQLFYSVIKQIRTNNDGFHLYALSNETIHHGDYVVNLIQYKEGYHNVAYWSEGTVTRDHLRKVIASSDPSLGLPLISEDFVSNYCTALKIGVSSFDQVEIETSFEYDCFAETQRDKCFKGSCNCPKKEILKLENNAVVLSLPPEEKTYTRKEVEFLLRKYKKDIYSQLRIFTTGEPNPFHKEWITNNLK